MFNYVKYQLVYLLTLPLIIGLTLGGNWLFLGFISAEIFIVAGDLWLGDDTKVASYKHPKWLNFQLYLALPVVLLINFLLLWSFADTDIFGYGAAITQLTGIDVLAARETNTIAGYVFAVLGCGLMTAVIATNIGHELTHRTSDKIALFIGRWLLAFSWDVGFSIEHVYGHHRYVGSSCDPATAPRGRNVYQHIIISTIKGNISAWELEKKRLQKQGRSVISLYNRYIRGLLMSLTLELAAYYLAGWVGVMVFTLNALFAKAILEIVNYMEHYGIVRDPASRVQPYHSWNTNKRISSWATFNLTRHSHHHAHGGVPFHQLKPYEDAPMMINGYLTTIFLTLIPPLWQKLMIPKVMEWDKHYASADELKLAEKANQQSGIKQLQQLDYSKIQT